MARAALSASFSWVKRFLTPFANCKSGQSTQHDSDLLDPTANQLEFLLILGGYFNVQSWTSYTLSMRQNIFN